MTTKKLVYLLFILSNASFLLQPPVSQARVKEVEDTSDWIPLPASQSLCGGYYGPYQEDVPLTPKEFSFELPMELSADESEFTFEGKSRFHGSVMLRQDNRVLHAEEVLIERSPLTREWEKLTAEGNLYYTAPNMRFFGQKASYQHSLGLFELEDVSYRLYSRHARGTAEEVNINHKTTIIDLHDTSFTTCAPTHNTWTLHAKDITLYPQKGRAVAKHAHLKLHDVPILYFPYINYPIDNKRHNGFLFPTFGTTSNSGVDILIPYYWNIAPNYDATLAARWLSERGMEGQTKFRYLLKNSEGTLLLHFLPDDRKYAAFQEENLSNRPGGLSSNDPRIAALAGNNSRLALNYRHTSQWERLWRFNIAFDYVKDDNYFVDLGNDINTASTIQLPQQANLTYFGTHWTHFFNVEEYQVLQALSRPINEEIYKRQPQWAFSTFYPNQFRHFTLGMIGEAVNFAHHENLFTGEPVTIGQRYNLRPSISMPLTTPWFFFTPRYQLDWLKYELDLGEDTSTEALPKAPSRTIPLYDIDAGLIFERNLHFRKYNFLQTLEPRMYYLYVPYRNQHNYPNFDSGVITFSYNQLFRDNRFSGRDRIGDTNQLSLSLMSRFIPSEGGQEWLRASVGEIFYFSDRKVTLCEQLGIQDACILFEDERAVSPHSNTVAQAELHANRAWSGAFFCEWDSLNLEMDQSTLNLQYHPNPNKIININYYWLRHDLAQADFVTGTTGSLHQTDISFLWPLALHWQVLSLWRYDLSQHQTVEVLGGLEYNGCCLALQFVASRYRQAGNFFYPEKFANTFFTQVVFKGLSGVGYNNPDVRLKTKIPGYISLEKRLQWLTKHRHGMSADEGVCSAF